MQKLDNAAAAHREELQSRENRFRAALASSRSEAEEAADQLRANCAAREMELHASVLFVRPLFPPIRSHVPPPSVFVRYCARRCEVVVCQ